MFESGVISQVQDQFQDAKADREKTERRRAPSFDVLLRRFFRDTQQSRILSITKEKRYKRKDVSRKMRRTSAVRKERIRRLKRGY